MKFNGLVLRDDLVLTSVRVNRLVSMVSYWEILESPQDDRLLKEAYQGCLGDKRKASCASQVRTILESFEKTRKQNNRKGLRLKGVVSKEVRIIFRNIKNKL